MARSLMTLALPCLSRIKPYSIVNKKRLSLLLLKPAWVEVKMFPFQKFALPGFKTYSNVDAKARDKGWSC